MRDEFPAPVRKKPMVRESMMIVTRTEYFGGLCVAALLGALVAGCGCYLLGHMQGAKTERIATTMRAER